MKIGVSTILPGIRQTYSVRENSFFAAIAARKLKSPKVALVLGKTVHLHQTTIEEFTANIHWLRHELCHIRQFKQYGFLRFLWLYLMESLRKGYYHNRFEAEARNAESG